MYSYIICSYAIFLFLRKSLQWARAPDSRGVQITHNDAQQSVGLLWTSTSN